MGNLNGKTSEQMDENPLSITKIDITFNDGRAVCMVTQDRFLRMRDLATAQSQANQMLVKQAELMEESISKLQAQCKSLEDELQNIFRPILTPASTPFQNPLP
jgi:hypothetical protein